MSVQADQKLIHAFGALAELGQEVTNKNSFQETIRTSLHLISGAIGIMRGGIARYSKFAHELNMIAVRALGDDFPLTMNLTPEDERQFLTAGMTPIDVSQAQVLPFFQVYNASFEGRRLELFIPLVVRDEIMGAIFLGEKATGESYTSYDKDVICAMGQHIGVAISQRNLMAEIERRADENRQLFE
ncbi:MAG: GAF domain-containing protein, partial [Acidobacteria bacterium]|nr:GAF domain-containing protein [Acidobacteriota bacterium]